MFEASALRLRRAVTKATPKSVMLTTSPHSLAGALLLLPCLVLPLLLLWLSYLPRGLAGPAVGTTVVAAPSTSHRLDLALRCRERCHYSKADDERAGPGAGQNRGFRENTGDGRHCRIPKATKMSFLPADQPLRHRGRMPAEPAFHAALRTAGRTRRRVAPGHNDRPSRCARPTRRPRRVTVARAQ
jgi:hypothetical protein